jgi:hypothetical protein
LLSALDSTVWSPKRAAAVVAALLDAAPLAVVFFLDVDLEPDFFAG